jgi:hypothetical protein
LLGGERLVTTVRWLVADGRECCDVVSDVGGRCRLVAVKELGEGAGRL